MGTMLCANASSKNSIQRHTHRLKRDRNSIPKWTQMTTKDNNRIEKTLCSSRKTIKRLTGPCYRTRCSASIMYTSSTRFTTARTTFISKLHTRKSSRTRRIWTWQLTGFNRVRSGLAGPADKTHKVARMAITWVALCSTKSTTTCTTSTLILTWPSRASATPTSHPTTRSTPC